MDTKEKILYNSLDMFTKSGFNAVSIRDIAESVNIKEISIYYHFTNKQDILDSIVKKYEEHISGLTDMLNTAINGADHSNPLSFDVLRTYFFEQYLFEPFCNKMMRFMMIEQFLEQRNRVAVLDIRTEHIAELREQYQDNLYVFAADEGAHPIK